jgi:UDP-glucose 4-epimerase
MFSQQSVLVTGGAGFIGSHLVEKLVALGADVTVLDDLSTGRLENLNSVTNKIQLCIGDLPEILQTRQLDMARYAYVFHLAANAYIPPSVENPAYDFQSNLVNTFLLLESLRALAQPPRFINTSSAAVYGNPVRLPIHESDPTVPISPYGVSKLAAERYVAVYGDLYHLPVVSLRLFSVYGPRQRKQVVYDLLRKLRADASRLEVLGDGTQVRDFINVQDVVTAMLLAATVAPAHGEVYNVAGDLTYTIKELVAVWCAVCNVTPQIIYSGSTRPGDAERWEVDLQNLKSLGFEPQVGLTEGLQHTAYWYDHA